MASVKKEVEESRHELIRRLILGKLKSIKREKFSKESIDKFSLVFRVFLLKYLNLNYEFTEEELVSELKKIEISDELKNKIISASDLLTKIKYEEKALTKEEFRSILKETENIVNLAVRSNKEEIKKENGKVQISKGDIIGFFHKIGLYKTAEEKKAVKKQKEEEIKKKEAEIKRKEAEKEQRRKEKELEKEKLLKQKQEENRINQMETAKKEEEKKKQIEEEKQKIKKENVEKEKAIRATKPSKIISMPPPTEKIDNIKLIERKVYEAEAMLERSKPEEAKRIYLETMIVYNSLSSGDKAKVHGKIKELFYKRKKYQKSNN